jgi:hypothetical protein
MVLPRLCRRYYGGAASSSAAERHLPTEEGPGGAETWPWRVATLLLLRSSVCVGRLPQDTVSSTHGAHMGLSGGDVFLLFKPRPHLRVQSPSSAARPARRMRTVSPCLRAASQMAREQLHLTRAERPPEQGWRGISAEFPASLWAEEVLRLRLRSEAVVAGGPGPLGLWLESGGDFSGFERLTI